MINRQDIEHAIAALEAQRESLDHKVVDTSLAALQRQLSHLQATRVSNSAMRGERRQVTVMFADISGFTAMSEKLDPEEVRGMINACFDMLGDAIDRYAGHIDKFIGDEIMALFGAPVAHENDPERSLRAALDMMAALDEFNRLHADKIPQPLALHFGINTGLAIAGGIGTSQRQDYSVMGDTVNLAARLEDLSEAGEILVGETTYRLTAPFFEFEARKPVKVKGKEQPVRVYRLLRAKPVAGGQLRGIEGLSSPLVGRSQEFEQLKEMLTQFYEGRGNVISIIGDAGLGKSRLIKELNIACAQNGRALWVEGRALSYGENASYLIARDVLRTMLGLDPNTSAAEAEATLKAAIRHLLPDQVAELYPFLAHLLEIPLAEGAARRIEYLEGDALHQRVLEAVQSYISAFSQQTPLVAVWEDLHWADPSSFRLLEYLAPSTQDCSLLLLLVYRRPVVGSRVWEFQQRIREIVNDTFTIVEMPPLNLEESGQLLDNLLGPDTLPQKTRQSIIAKAEGNPFYLEEVIRSLINGGAVTPAENGRGWTVAASIDEIKLPDTLQGVIMSRIDQLDPETKRVLQVASVIGRNFSQKVLDRVAEKIANGRPDILTRI